MSFLFVYPSCKDNDVMNGERERMGKGREREGEMERKRGEREREGDFKANAWGDVRQTCVCVITTEVKMLHRH